MTALLTDFYELTMAYAYWKKGIASMESVFHLFFRKKPFGGSFAIAAGLESVLEFLEEFNFSSSDLAYLSTIKNKTGHPLFEPDFLDFLSHFKFCCDIDAVPEGTVVFPYEPLIRVKGPILQAQLLESVLLNTINFQTLIATKAARVCFAAAPDPVVEFGLRRAQGIDGALSASRAAFIGGCTSTSNTLAGKLFNIPVKGTHAHSWIMAFPTEEEAFTAWGTCMPYNVMFLLDTYDSIQGAHVAIKVAKKLKLPNFGVRLDSGDLAVISRKVRAIFDENGFKDVVIMASNELDEVVITDLKRQGACIDLWGVGTHLVTGQTQPALDGVYKLSAIRSSSSEPWNYKIKKSEQIAKVTDPGVLQIRRFSDKNYVLGDLIYNTEKGMPQRWEGIDPLLKFSSDVHSEDLLIPIMRKGKQVRESPTLLQIQQRAKDELGKLPSSMRRFLNPEPYPVALEKMLYEMKGAMLREM